MSAERIGTLIVGAGPAGLGAAWRLAELGRSDWLLLERAARPGGLSASFRDEAGFTWDQGGHILFSADARFGRMLDEVLPGGLLDSRRRVYVRLAGSQVPYPFQSNLHALPAALREECLAGLEAAAAQTASAPPANFGEWVDRSFGGGIARHFMRPYNRKIWCCELTELSAAWVGERVARPDPEALLAAARAGRGDDAWGPNASFRFPKSGGIGAVWEALAAKLPAGRLRFGAAVAAVDLARRAALLADGEELGYQRLIWTGPLDALVRAAGRKDLAAAAGQLRHTSVEVFGLGLAGAPPEAVRDVNWLYFPEPACPFYRATVFSNYSPAHVPPGGASWSLMLEVARRPSWPGQAEWLWPRVLAAVAAEGLAPEEAGVLSRWHRTLDYAYPVPSLGRDAALAELLPVFEAAGVHPRGRFGAWRYEAGNMDHCFLQGIEAADVGA